LLSCSLALLLFIGCSDSLSLSAGNEADPVIVNGWSLFSESGKRAIEDQSAETVYAVKEDFSEELDTEVCINVTGDFESVLDRVNDPFFGLDNEIDMNDPEIIAYIKKMESGPNPDLSTAGMHHITLSIEPSVSGLPRGTTIHGFKDTSSLSRTAGTTVSYRHGFAFLWPQAGTVIHDATPGGIVDCTLYTKPLWGGDWSKNKKSNNIDIDDGQVNTGGFAIGWYNWETDAMILIGISW